MSEESIVGIDLGTTNSAIGIVESGFPILFANNQGRRVIPSAVYYAQDGTAFVGDAALRRKMTESSRVVTSVKRLMGLRSEDVTSSHKESYFQTIVQNENGELALELEEGLRVSPVEVSAEILKELKKIAEERLDREVNRAVITIPAYFNEAQRSATKRAGEMAGFTVERLLAEPTAAALSYGLNKKKDGSKVAVYDLGGGTFDISVLELNDGVFQVLATAGDTQLGGDDFDESVFQWIVSQAQKKGFNLEQIKLQEVRLRQEAREAKEKLSMVEEYLIRLPFLDGKDHLELSLTRSFLEQALKANIEKTVSLCKKVLIDSGFSGSKDEISTVVLVGGSTRVPAVQNTVAEIFGQFPNLSQHPDEAIALGASIQAGILSGAVRKVVLLDVTPLSLGIETYGGLMNVLIPRNTTIPCKAGEMFTNASDSQQTMKIRVLQGEREMAKDNWELGEFDVEFSRDGTSKARVGVQFALDENGLLEVLVRDTATGEDTVVEIQSKAVDVSDERVEEMIGASIDHAFEDMDQRVFTEAKIKAEELLPAVQEAIHEAGSLLSAEQLSDIKGKAESIQGMLQSPSRVEGADLKQAVEQLDHATERLATIIVEKAMEDALARQIGES